MGGRGERLTRVEGARQSPRRGVAHGVRLGLQVAEETAQGGQELGDGLVAQTPAEATPAAQVLRAGRADEDVVRLIVFLFRQFFADTPRELLDAARVDGLTWFGVYGRIVVPLSMPVMVSAGLVLFLSQWQSFFWPLLVTNSPQYQMVQVALSTFQGEYVTRWNDIFAGSVVATIIPMVLLLFLQPYYVRTIARTGLVD